MVFGVADCCSEGQDDRLSCDAAVVFRCAGDVFLDGAVAQDLVIAVVVGDVVVVLCRVVFFDGADEVSVTLEVLGECVFEEGVAGFPVLGVRLVLLEFAEGLGWLRSCVSVLGIGYPLTF